MTSSVIIVFLLLCFSYCFVSLPPGALGWSVIVAFPRMDPEVVSEGSDSNLTFF